MCMPFSAEEKKIKVLLCTFSEGFVWNCVFFIFLFLIYLSSYSQSEVGISTGFPILTKASELLVGCLRVWEPILSPHLDKLKHTWGGF